MKRFVLTLALAAAILLPGMALDSTSPVHRLSAYPELTAMIYPEAVGQAFGFSTVFDFATPKGRLNPFLGARVFFGKTQASSFTDSDFYATLNTGLRLVLKNKPEAELSSIAFRIGMDLGGGYSVRVTSSSSGYFSFIWEPGAKLEWRVRGSSFSIGGGYRGIVSPTGGWTYKKNAPVLNLGYLFEL